MTQSMDAGIGRELNALRRAGNGEDTLVIFTSGNGGERYSYNWPLSFQKGFLGEGGIDLATDAGEKVDLRQTSAEMFARIKPEYEAWNARMLPRIAI